MKTINYDLRTILIKQCSYALSCVHVKWAITDHFKLTYTLYCVVMLVVLLLLVVLILSDMQVYLVLLHLPMFLLVRMAISCVLLVKPQME